ncbi:hypothetical protein ACFVTM_08840 [Arthrobacter sp. NPDC058130]|uniref:hypothetical protein n=1 Tax=Arthrobacter sp. NPDC058130 TaxID=3346353 RepID=UPI0036EC1554
MLTTLALVVGGVVFAIAFIKFTTKSGDSEASSTGEGLFGAAMATGMAMTAVFVVGTFLFGMG